MIRELFTPITQDIDVLNYSITSLDESCEQGIETYYGLCHPHHINFQLDLGITDAFSVTVSSRLGGLKFEFLWPSFV